MKNVLIALGLVLFAAGSAASGGAPDSFYAAKGMMRFVYADNRQTFYCQCDFRFTRSRGGSGKPDLSSCGYQVRKQPRRASRIEWEHVVPAYNLGRQRACWRAGGRENCSANDPVFSNMEADMHNLVPAVGEVNADRSNYRFQPLPGVRAKHGACPFKVDFGTRAVEPREGARGQIARIYFYMHDRYGLSLSDRDERILIAWDRQHPVTAHERSRDEHIAQYMGHSNPFVTGRKTWVRGYKPSGDGLLGKSSSTSAQASGEEAIRGHRGSKIYHLPEGCPSYDMISARNVREFDSEFDAVQAGYRKAYNCD